MRKAKILYVIGTLNVGGAETQLVELASRIDRSRFDPVVCCISAGGELVDTLRARGVRVHLLNFSRAFPGQLGYVLSIPRMIGMVWHLFRLIRRERPAIIHGFLLQAYLLAAFVGRLAGVPVVVAGRRSLGLFKENKCFYLMLERLADRMTDLFIANSAAVRQDTLAREPISETDIVVIYNGLDLSRFQLAANIARPSELDIGDAPRVIVVSNFIHYKGHDYFLRAWSDVLRSFPTATALLVGDGTVRSDMENLSSSLSHGRSVRFLGVRHDVPALLAVSDIYVHPSLQEGFSNSLLEAMAAGLPVIATSVGGNVEAVSDAVTGMLVPPRDTFALSAAMTRLLCNPIEAKAMGDRARAAVRARHEVGAMIRSYESVYSRLLHEAGRLEWAPGDGTAAS
jgi:glycosyltransferase involved in cell wall biosynthesis